MDDSGPPTVTAIENTGPPTATAPDSTGDRHGKGQRSESEFRIGEVVCCPLCATPFSAVASSIVQEYWVFRDRYFDLWCGTCRRHAILVLADRVVTMEPAGNPHDHP